METQRTIQFYGLLIPNADFVKAKFYEIRFELIREPRQPYTNLKYPSPKGLYGYLQCMSAGRVVCTYPLEYINQVVCRKDYTDFFLHQAVSCHLEAMLTSFINVANYLQPGFVIQRDNPIKTWVTSSADFDEIRVRFLDERTVGRIVLDYDLMDSCNVLGSDLPTPKKPVPPPNSEVPVPADIPNNQIPPISPPYEGIDDNGLTYNPDGNLPPGDLQGEQCTPYGVIFAFDRRITFSDGTTQVLLGVPQTASLWGKIGAITSLVSENEGKIFIASQGFSFLDCDPQILPREVWSEVLNPTWQNFEYLNVRIIELVP
jgi:hypothetical protein